MAVIRGTSGNDRMEGADEPDLFKGLAGNDNFRDFGGNDTIRGGSGNDFLIGDTGDDILLGDKGNDTIFGDAGKDTLNGGDGFDTVNYEFAPSEVTVDLGSGFALDGYVEFGRVDKLTGFEAVTGSDYSDFIRGDSDMNRLIGLAGNDTLDGRNGVDQVGYFLSPTGIFVDLAAGFAQDGFGTRDRLIGIEQVQGSRHGPDIILGDEDDNAFFSYDGNDRFNGRGGDDFFSAHGGHNTIDGGRGVDTVSYVDEVNGVEVDLKDGLAEHGAGRVDTLRSIENLSGSDYDDRLFGDGAANDIGAYDGDDRVEGRGGKDTLWGGRGDDTIKGGGGGDLIYSSDGGDVLIGGKGRDSLTFDSDQRSLERGQIVGIVDLAAGTLRSEGEIEVSQRAEGFENVLGTLHDFDVAVSVDLSIAGTKGRNLLIGGNGFDTIEGGRGKDTLDGAGGNDRLAGEGGDDTLTGGGGTDRFLFSGDWGTDTVTDFRLKGRVERLEIAGADEAGSIRAFKRASTMKDGDLVYDAGGDGENVIVLEGIGIAQLRANDIDFI